MKKRIYTITIAIIAIAASMFFLIDFSQLQKSEEATMMESACDDVKEFKMFQAKMHIEELKFLIENHPIEDDLELSMRQGEILQDLESLINELDFHNTDFEMYNESFGYILRELSVLMLADAVQKIEVGDRESALISVHEACHYFHDATLFHKGKLTDKEREIIKNLRVRKTKKLDSLKIQKYSREIEMLL